METAEYRSFCDQLAAWCRQIIAKGGSPVRAVDTLPALLTEAGMERPPVVLWVNRESRLAAGAILIPKTVAEGERQADRVADALGISHAALWLETELRLMVRSADGWQVQKSWSFLGDNPVLKSQEGIVGLFESLRLLAVTGNIPPAQTSPLVGSNLILSAVEHLDEELQKRLRRDGFEEGPALTQRSLSASLALTGAMILADWRKALSDHATADELTDSLWEVAPREGVSFPALFDQAVIEPGHAGAVILHRLLHRLRQLASLRDADRLQETLVPVRTLLAERCGLDGFGAGGEDSAVDLLINCNGDASQLILPEPVALLQGVIDRIAEHDRCVSTSVFSLATGTSPGSIVADWQIEHPLQAADIALLRISWPNRRFRVSTRTPGWVAASIHLLGMVQHQGGRLRMRVGAVELFSRPAEPLLQILGREVLPVSVALDADGVLELVVEGKVPDEVRIVPAEGPLRQLSPEELPLFPGGLRTAVRLPDSLYRLIRRREWIPLADGQNLDRSARNGIDVLLASSAGRFLWNELGGESRLPVGDQLMKRLQELGYPFPPAAVLSGLADRVGSGCERQRCNREVEEILSVPPVAPPAKAKRRKTVASGNHQPSVDGLLEQAIVAHGVPDFPDQYLYGEDIRQKIEYQFQGRLTLGDGFMGEFELRDETGECFRVQGEECARALIFASYGGKRPVVLPDDRLLVAQICRAYRDELGRLRGQLLLLASEQSAPEGVGRLIERVWRKMGLPPWELIEG